MKQCKFTQPFQNHYTAMLTPNYQHSTSLNRDVEAAHHLKLSHTGSGLHNHTFFKDNERKKFNQRVIEKLINCFPFNKGESLFMNCMT